MTPARATAQRGDPYIDEYLRVVDIGSQKQLFVDDTVVMDTAEVRRVFHKPKKLPENPILRPTEPSEDMVNWVPTPGRLVPDLQDGVGH